MGLPIPPLKATLSPQDIVRCIQTSVTPTNTAGHKIQAHMNGDKQNQQKAQDEHDS